MAKEAKAKKQKRIRNTEKRDGERDRKMETKTVSGEVRLLIEEKSPIRFCRICHEEDDDDISTPMDSPCACSGTLKFAHRGCVQRWCDEKGSTHCEICLQKFEPGYRLSPLTKWVRIGVSIRESLEAYREDLNPSNSNVDDDYGDSFDHNSDCSPPTSIGASLCRSLVIAFTLGLLLRHLLVVLYFSDDNHMFPLFSVLLLRAVGILVPFFVFMKVISTVEKMQARNRGRWLAAAVDEMQNRESDVQQSAVIDEPQMESIQTQ